MTFDYSRSKATATRLIQNFGALAQFIYDAGTNDITFTAYCVFLPLKQNERTNTTVETQEMNVFVDVTDIREIPEVGSYINRNGDNKATRDLWRISQVEEIRPGDTQLLLKLRVEK